MGAKAGVNQRIVFDTSTVLSALVYRNGSLSWLRSHWRNLECVPLLSADTAAELNRVFAYPKFGLSPESRHEILAEYVPYCELVTSMRGCLLRCRDSKDQPFLDLAHSGDAAVLVSSDKDLLVLAGETSFVIETPEAYRLRVAKLRGR